MKKSQDNDNKRPPFALFRVKGGFAAALVIVTVLSAALLAGALTGAWQVFNRSSRRGELAIVSETTELALSECSLYRGEVTTDASGATSVTGVMVSSPTEVIMNGYDSVVGRNDDSPIYIRLTVAGKKVERKEPVTITIKRENTGTLKNATDAEGLRYTKTDVSQHWTAGKVALNLSNVVTAQFAQIASVNTVIDADTVYTTCKAQAWDVPYSFFSSIPEAHGRHTTLGDITKSNSLSYTFAGYDTTTYDSGITTAVFFIRLNYSQALVEVYLNDNYTAMAGRLNQRVSDSFNADVTRIEISAAP